jgi:hypothetical protein
MLYCMAYGVVQAVYYVIFRLLQGTKQSPILLPTTGTAGEQKQQQQLQLLKY